MKKSQKIAAIVVPIVVILIALIIVLCLLLPKNNENKCADGHTYKYTDLNEENHKKSCENCDKVDETEAHKYDNDTDAECNDCGHTRTVHTTHTYEYTKADDTNHTKTCSGCDDINITEAHTFRYAKVDGTNHKVTCTVCDYVKTVEHTYDDESDATCNQCGEERHIHSYVYADKDDTTHTVTCSACTEVNKTEAHTQGDACEKCGHFFVAPSNVAISASKTNLVAGDTFTLSIEIKTLRKNTYWSSVDMNFGPLNEAGTKASPEIASYFELVSYTSNWDQYATDGKVSVDVVSAFAAEKHHGLHVIIAYRDEPIPTTESIKLDIVLKVKDDAPTVSSFDFGVAPIRTYYTAYNDFTGELSVVDRANDSTIISINKIPMTITSKGN